VGLLGELCSHRRASLFYGRNEEGGLRCVYHGWKYDVEGNILETPAEPVNSTLQHKVRHLAYPCREASGVVFTYMGPRDKMLVFPNFDWLTVPRDHVTVTKFFLESNYLQALEGDCDPCHTAYLHRGNIGRGLEEHEDLSPFYEIETTWCGIRCATSRQVDAGRKWIGVSTFAMPFIGSVPRGKEITGKLDGFLAVYQVPCDDFSTWRYNFRFKKSEPMTEAEIRFDSSQVGVDFRLIANRNNGYLLDRDRQRTRNFTGIEGFATQDACVTESMEPIVDRSQEHLGMSDSFIIALRRFLLKAVRDFEKGINPPGVIFHESQNDFSAANSTSVYVPAELESSWREVEKRVYGVWRSPQPPENS
jgi:phenylpropionate dioxygenase-like ring-hydroxylating dioxygenase large terminal subunit